MPLICIACGKSRSSDSWRSLDAQSLELLTPRDTDLDTIIDALDTDDDGDGWLTELEDAHQNGNWLDDDTDGDGIPNYRDSDSDNDGYADGVEILAGTDPLDALSFPPPAPAAPSEGPLGWMALAALLVGVGGRFRPKRVS